MSKKNKVHNLSGNSNEDLFIIDEHDDEFRESQHGEYLRRRRRNAKTEQDEVQKQPTNLNKTTYHPDYLSRRKSHSHLPTNQQHILHAFIRPLTALHPNNNNQEANLSHRLDNNDSDPEIYKPKNNDDDLIVINQKVQ